MADLTIEVSIDAKATKSGADEAKRAVKSIGDEAEKSARKSQSLAKIDFSAATARLQAFGDKLKNVGSQISGVGQTLTLFLTTAILTFATFGITSQANLEKAEVSFTRFIKNTKGFTGSLGDARKEAQLLMKDLQNFADTTPFESEEIIASGRTLLAAKIPRAEIKDFLKDAGDLAAAANTSILEVSQAMSRLKSGDFGEAFERLRDFGISKEDLTAQGLEFDKGGAFKGSTDEALKAVREIIKQRFGDTMDDLSQTLSGRFSTLIDKGKAFFRELFLPAFEYAKPAIDFVVKQIEFLTAYLTQLSPQVKLIIVGILAGLAALGPVLVVIGTIITAIGGLVGAISAIASAWATVSAAVAAAGGVFAALGAVVVPALVVIAKVALPVIAVIGALVAIGAALYFAWSTNFGGLRDLTNEIFAQIQSYIQTALVNIQAFWASYGQQIIQTAMDAFNSLIEFLRPIMTEIVNYVREGFRTMVEVAGPLWTQVVAFVKTQLTSLSVVVRVVLAAISEFWRNHGEQIKTMVSAVWTILKTIVLTGIRQVANVITLVLAIINGDWSAAWQAFQNIVRTGVNATITILKSLGTLVVAALSFVVTRLYEIGKNIIQGLLNGIKSGVSAVYETVTGIANKVIGIFKTIPDVQSPSRVTTEIGEFIVEGLAVGMENKSSRAVGAARKVAGEVIKELKNALAEFNKLAGASPETVRNIQQTNRVRDAASSQQEIIKLRGELGVNQFRSLPSSVTGTEAELRYLQSLKQASDEFNKSLDDLLPGVEEMQEAVRREQEAFDKRLESIRQNGDLAILNLQEEISLIGISDDFEKQRIQNFYEILKLREQMKNDGYGQQQIDAEAETLRLEQARQLELQKILQIRKQVAAAGDLEKSLLGELSNLRNGNRELSEYEKTLQKINQALKNISPEQKEYLLNLAQSIDLQKEFNDQYEQTFEFIRNALGILTDESKSFGDKMKEIFNGIFQSFKKMLLDMVSEYLSSKLLQIFKPGNGGAGGNGSSSSSGGFSFGNILQQIFGGGRAGGGSTPPFNPGFSSFPNTASVGGQGVPFIPGIGVGAAQPPSGNSGGGGGQSGSGSNLAGTLALIGTGANILGGFIGGRAGRTISGAGQGLALGATIGSIVPGIGTVIGATVGAIAGGLIGLFGGDPKRKRDKNEKIPALQKGFSDALQQLRALGADKIAFYDNPEGTIQKALELRAQIASGFGIQMESKKYSRLAQQQIAAKLIEADAIIADLMKIKDKAVFARDVDTRLQTSFATGVYMSPEFLAQYGDFKRRNGILPGTYTGRDTLPSMLAAGEMVLNPDQIRAVIRNAGFDVFKNAGIPGYANGIALAPTVAPAPASSAAALAPTIVFQPKITVMVEAEGISDARIKEVLVDGLSRSDVQVEVVKAYDKGKLRSR
jgi:phage-related protein